MKWAALIAWVVTAGLGFAMLAVWLKRGGMRQSASGRIRPPLILSHFLPAAAGLVLWIVYIADDSDTVKWIAFGTLVVVALLGWTMFFIWAKQRSMRSQPVESAVPAVGPAEQHFPIGVIALHGLAAVTTVVLVFLTAIGVGGS